MSKHKNYSNYYNEKKSEDQVNKVEDEEVVEGEYPIKDREFSIIPTLGVVVNCNKLNVRKESNAGSEIVDVLDKGTSVEIVGESNGFRKVKIDDTIGYCMSFYIEETK